jgi:hypothetical protein
VDDEGTVILKSAQPEGDRRKAMVDLLVLVNLTRFP